MRSPLLVLLATLLVPAAASAGDMDVTLARLRAPPGPDTCPAMGDNGLPRMYCADEDAWRRLTSQLGFSLAPPVLSPARTTGYGGLYVGVEGWVTGIDSDADYWQVGTEGDEGSLDRNRFPDSTLIWSRLVARKGFPFGIELGTSFAKLLNTSYWAWGLEVKWALVEGFRYAFGTVLPDIAVRGMVNTMVGDPEFNLTVPSLDFVVSKRITVAGTAVITPILSYQIAWIFADSELVDLTPEIDAFDECRPETDSSSTTCTRDPASIPSGRGPGEDYNNNTTFDELRATRQRLAIGVRGEYQALTLTATFTFDLAKPGDQDDEVPDDLPRQWTVAAGAGLSF